jgi:DNA-binding transcriptional regulator YiaG
MMTALYGPNTRTDSIPLHPNAIRRFREELRMNRPVFAELLDINVDTLRVWEANKSKPRGPAALKIIAVATRNDYPMSIEEIFQK